MIIKTKPEDFERRILLAVAGGSPAIVTETLYALTQTSVPAYLPTELHIITTSGKLGHEASQKALIDEQRLKQLCETYGIPMPLFDTHHIHRITNAQGKYLTDITTASDNEAAADFITTKVREFTRDENTSLHVSIAGGRKTMTYYLGYAMSVFGRIQDRMSHVLVDDRYAIPGFYYPTHSSFTINNSRNGDSFDAKDVVVTLGELPFIRLRDGLTEDLLNNESTSYSKLIETAQRQFAPINVRVIYGDTTELYCGGEKITLPDSQLALYIWMLQRRKSNKVAVDFTDKIKKSTLADEFKKVYGKVSRESGHFDNTINEIDTDYFGAPRTRINNKLKNILGKPGAKPYLIESYGNKNAKQYDIAKALKPEHIIIEEPKTLFPLGEKDQFLNGKLV